MAADARESENTRSDIATEAHVQEVAPSKSSSALLDISSQNSRMSLCYSMSAASFASSTGSDLVTAASSNGSALVQEESSTRLSSMQHELSTRLVEESSTRLSSVQRELSSPSALDRSVQKDSDRFDCSSVWNLDALQILVSEPRVKENGDRLSPTTKTSEFAEEVAAAMDSRASANLPEISKRRSSLKKFDPSDEGFHLKKPRTQSRVRFSASVVEDESDEEDDRQQRMITVHFRDKLESVSSASSGSIYRRRASTDTTPYNRSSTVHGSSARSRFQSDLNAVISESEGEDGQTFVPVEYNLPMSAFEVCHSSFPKSFPCRQTKYTFTRSDRNSLLLDWGLPLPQQNAQPHSTTREQRRRISTLSSTATRYRARTSLTSAWSGGSGWSSFWTNTSSNVSFFWGYLDVIDPYTKATDTFCLRNFLAIAMGPGSLNIPAGISLCGYIPGFLILLLMILLQASLADRLIEAPMLLNTDLENYVDIAAACFNFSRYPRVRSLIVGSTKVMTISGFFGICTINLLTIMWSFKAIFGVNGAPYWFLWSFCVCCVCFLFMNAGFSTHIRDLRTTSRACLFIMHSLLVFVSFCSVWNRVDPKAKPIKYTAWGTSSGLFEGASLILFNCNGMIYLPFVFSDLYDPATAEGIVRKAYRHLAVFWLTMAFFGYFGWGDSAGTGFFDISYTVLGYFPVTGCILRAMIGIQAFLSYPLLFAPLFRMAECLLALDASPAVSLHLPWAIRKLWWEKKGLQVSLVFAGLVSNIVSPYIWMEGFAWLPTNFCSMILPAGFSFVFEVRRRNMRATEAAASELTTPISEKRGLITRARDSITLNSGFRIASGSNIGGVDSNASDEEKPRRNIIVPLVSLVLGLVILLAGAMRLGNSWQVTCRTCTRKSNQVE